MKETDIDSLLLRIQSLLELIEGDSGKVFYSGRKTVDSPSRYYLMGLNPGGDPCDPDLKMETIGTSLTDWAGRKPEWSEYCDVDWRGKKSDPKDENPGNSRHQKAVRSFCSNCLGESVRNVFSANAIFERTKRGEHLREDPERDRVCWQVHQLLFSRIQPEYIICLGHGSGSSFQRLKEKLDVVIRPYEHSSQPEKENERRFYIRWFERDQIQAQVSGLERLVRVIGVPHPSWFALGADKFKKEWNSLSPLCPTSLRGKS